MSFCGLISVDCHTVRVFKEIQGRMASPRYSLWFVPKRYGYSERTKCVLPVVELLMKKLASKEIPFEPGETMVSVSVGDPRLMCVGVIRGISGIRQRAALCAGGTVCNVLSVDDGRQDVERIFELRRQPLDAVVLAGGVDEGIGRREPTSYTGWPNCWLSFAERLRRRKQYSCHICGFREGREAVMNILGDKTEVIWAENVRSKLEEEYLEPARDAIIQCFAGRVHKDPRYKGIGKLGFPSVFPAGHLLGRAVELIANAHQEDVLALSLDGDQIQVVSRIKKISTRTVTHISSVDTAAVSSQLPSESLLGIAGNVWENLKLRPAALPLDWNETAVFMSFGKKHPPGFNRTFTERC